MLLIWTGVERLLLLFFWMARALFILQGLAFACASVTTFAVAGAEAPAWLQRAMVSALLISGTFFAAGLLLMAARRWLATATSVGDEPTWPWPLLLGLSLLVLPAVAGLAASGLPSLWTRIGAQLAALNFWDAIARNDPYGGIVLLPILLALSVPVLLTAAAAFSIAFPLSLLPLLAVRSRLFPTLLAMGVICQVALVLTGWIAADVFARLATQAMAALAASGDAEVVGVGNELNWATGILARTALALVAPTLGMLAWLAFLRPSGAAAGYFATDASLGLVAFSDPPRRSPLGRRRAARRGDRRPPRTRRSRAANDRSRAIPAAVRRPVSGGLVGTARRRRGRPTRLVLFRR